MNANIKLKEQEMLTKPPWLTKGFEINPNWVKGIPGIEVVTESFFAFLEGTPQMRKLRREMREIFNIKRELRRKKEMVRDERVKRAALEKKLSAAYAEIKAMEEQNTKLKQAVAELQLTPVRSQQKLNNLKALVNEMRAEIKRLQPKNEEMLPIAELEELPYEDLQGQNQWQLLSQKKIGIIGGFRPKNVFRRHDNVATMTGRENLDEFELFVKGCDIVVVLTEHIGHYPMWTAKAFCVEYGKPIVYTRHTNLLAIYQQIESGVLC